jgi:hypothetical protein
VLEINFEGDLPNASRESRSYCSKVSRTEVSLYLLELRVIKDVKEFDTEFCRDPLSEVGGLTEGHIPVVDSGAAKKGPLRISWLSPIVVQGTGLRSEGGWREIEAIGLPRIEDP